MVVEADKFHVVIQKHNSKYTFGQGIYHTIHIGLKALGCLILIYVLYLHIHVMLPPAFLLVVLTATLF